MPERARVEAVLELAVEIALVGDAAGEEVAAREIGSCRRGGVVEAKQRRVGDVDMGETRILPERHAVGEITLKLIAEHFLLALEGVDAGVAGEQAVGMRPNGAATTVPT